MVYKIVGNYPGDQYFAINNVTGVISMINSVRNEPGQLGSYTLFLEAYDSVYPNRKADTSAIVYVTRDPNAPVFLDTSYVISIIESVDIDTELLNITATDADGDVVRYRIINSQPAGGNNYFYLDPDTGMMKTRAVLTGAPSNTYSFTVQAYTNRDKSSNIGVTINIQRIPSDIRPRFTNINFARTIPYTQSVSSSIFKLTAVDDDLKGAIQYEVIGFVPATNFFNVNPTSGDITVTRNLSTDTNSGVTYVLRVDAYDTNNPNLRATETVTITVNRNPNGPVFQPTSYAKSIPETYAVTRSILQVIATDADRDTVQFYISNDASGIEAQKYFLIDGLTGIVYVRDDLTKAPQNNYLFNVIAYDNRSPQKRSQASVSITIQRDGGSPFFTPSAITVTIPDTMSVNTNIRQITATDNDRQGDIRYRAVGNGLAMAYFGVNDVTGNIFVKSPLLDTTVERFDLRIAAYDTEFPNNYGYINVTIVVTRNQGVPVFDRPSYSASVYEYRPVGNQVLTVVATDSDGDAVRYSLDGGPDDNEFFYIDPVSGIIYHKKTFNANVQNEYRFNVVATDQRFPFNRVTAPVVITITPDQAPIFQTMSGFNLNESLINGNSVGRVQANDTDLLGSIVYEVVGNTPAPSFFTVDPSTGAITVRGNLRQAGQRNMMLRIAAYDSAVPTKKTFYDIPINIRINSGIPVFGQSPYRVTIDERSPLGFLVESVVATDPDGDSLTYRITGSGNAPQYFYIDPTTGQVFLKKSVFNIVENQFTLNIVATDRPLLTQTGSVDLIVTITKDQTPPRFTSGNCQPSIVEKRPIGSTFATVAATDDDNQGAIVYGITGIYPAQSFFDINNSTGQIFIKEDLKNDGLARPQYLLRVIAYSINVPDRTAEIICTINVLRNEFTPAFNPKTYNPRILETHPFAVAVENITATDGDGDSITYSLVRDRNGGDGLNYFYIDPQTGSIYLKQPVLGINRNIISLEAVVTDSGRPSKQDTAIININIDKIVPPSFNLPSPQRTTLREDVPIGSSVFDLTATKTGAQSDVRYRIVGLDTAPIYFAIDPITGRITNTKDLRLGRELTYTLRVEAYDVNYPQFTSQSDLIINMNRNFYAPVFSGQPYVANIGDDHQANNPVIQINATDNDGDKLTYSLVNSNGCRDIFYIASDTGIMYVTKDLRTFTGTAYDCTVSVTDNGYPTPKVVQAPVRINVERQPAPSFTLTTYTGSTQEGSPVGTLITTVTATKTPLIGRINYEIIGTYPAPSFFEINNSTGRITISRNLGEDPLRLEKYQLVVVATDTGKPGLSATSTVDITVGRNRDGPVITPPIAVIDLPEATNPNFWFYKVNVTDPDSRTVTCSISGSPKSQEFFAINPTTCLISLRKPLSQDTDNTLEYTINVVATDDGSPPKVGTGIVRVRVSRDNSNPSFIGLPANVDIKESVSPNTNVYTVQGTDADLKGNLVYELVGDFPCQTFFQIDRNSGVIRVRNSPKSDSLQTLSYTCRVQIYDDAWPNNKQQGVVTINVERNEGTPIFVGSPYSVSIADTRPPGDLVLAVAATDSDGDRLRYTHLGTNTDKEFFYLNPNTGEIVVAKDLTETTATRFQFNVEVTDDRTPEKKSTAVVTINVSHNSGPPRFIGAPYSQTLPISTDANVQVVRAQATDPDLQGSLQFRLVGFGQADSYFQINAQTGQITTRQQLRLNTQQFVTYTMLVEVFDTARPNEIATTSVVVTINRNEKSPVFTSPSYTATINDYDGPGTSVITVTATDDDLFAPEKSVIYSFGPSRNALDYFQIDPLTGLISVKQRPSADTARPGQYELIVVATDSGTNQNSATSTVTITVRRNNAPVIDRTSRLDTTVSENVDVFSNIITVVASDQDLASTLNGQVEYRLGSADAMRIFQIDTQSGSISSRIGLQTVTQERWLFEVIAYDKGIPSLSDTATATITIARTGKLNFVPSEYSSTQPENLPLGSPIITLQVADPVLGSRVKYEIRGDSAAPEYFIIDEDTGVLTINKSFTEDPNKVGIYTVRVAAYRESDPNEFAIALVRVTVIRNPNSPVFGHGNLFFTLSENFPLGQQFGDVNATDADTDMTGSGLIVYSIDRLQSTPNYVSDYFFVNPSTGQLSVITRLSNDPNQNTYLFNVIAQDRGTPRRQSSISVTVNVTRNSNPPRFNPSIYDVTINETHSVGDKIVDVFATDADPNDVVSYSLIEGPTDALYFRFRASTNTIELAQSVERDNNLQYQFRVRATDNVSVSPRTGTALVRVTVVRNPNAPEFGQSNYNVTISEYEAVRNIIARIPATDKDSINSLSGQIRYSITSVTPNNGLGYFVITPNTGDIILSQQLTRSGVPDRFELRILARDMAASPKSATTTLTINVVRNRFAPVFSIADNNGVVSQNSPVYTTILRANATDEDMNDIYNRGTPNAQIKYSIVDNTQPGSQYFGVYNDGTVYVRQSLFNEDSDLQTLPFTLRASDSGWNYKSTDIQVEIKLTKATLTEGDLGFIQPVYYIEQKENTAIGTTIQDLNVENQGSEIVRCTFISGNEGTVFTVDTDTDKKNCFLKLQKELDYEVKNLYNMTLLVEKDVFSGRKKRQTENIIYNTWRYTTVIVAVLDVNDNDPIFIFPVYPDGTTPNLYITAIPATSKPNEIVTTTSATDADSGRNAEIEYQMDPDNTQTPPFTINPVEGTITTTIEFEITPEHTHQNNFNIIARDNPVDGQDRVAKASVVVNFIEQYNRFILVLKDREAKDVLPQRETIRQMLQDTFGRVCLIERVEGKRVLQETNNLVVEMASTDVTFVLAEINGEHRLLNNTNPAHTGLVLGKEGVLGSKITAVTAIEVERVRVPYAQAVLLRGMVTKSYIWWMDDPWAALIALAAIIILLSIVGIIVIVFTYSRYVKFINQIC
ncbi:protocadherin Fat 4 [Patella vulgata]|uniref:protocadherin Fat 4 n=1 Tax=Patella vulgata TaxID=6465 RepID=UPI0024A7E829|nr:protocadherin Fat 4 [Patella vulgata]